MRINKALLYLSLLVIFQIKALQSHGQNIDLNELISHYWVDSVFESLSITERINQLLVLDVDEFPSTPSDYPTAFGGIILESSDPLSHGN